MSYGTVVANPGAGGAAFAEDTVAAKVYPMGKIIFGGEGVVTEVTAATPLPVLIGDGTRQASVRDTGANDSLNVAIVDAAGAQIVTFGGGTEYTEGDVDATITGKAILWEDAADTLRAVSAAKPLPVDTELPAAALLADAAALPTTPKVGSVPMVYNGATLDLVREVVNATDTTGTGIPSAGLLAQFDDVSPSTVTENRFGAVRMSKRRNLYGDHGITELATSGSWTSATAINTAMSFDVTALSTVLLFVNATGGVPTGGEVSFSGTTGGSPATTLGLIGLDKSTGLSIVGSISLPTNFASVLSFDVRALTTFTATLSSVITGAATVTLQARGIAAPGGGITYVKQADGLVYTAPYGSALLAAVTHTGGEGDINLDVSAVTTVLLRITGSGTLVLATPYLFQAKDGSGAIASNIWVREMHSQEMVDRYAGFKSETRYYIFNVAGATVLQLTQGTFSAGSVTISAEGSAGYNPGAQAVTTQPAAPRVSRFTHVPIAVSATTGDNVLVAGVANQTVRVMDINLVFTSAISWKFRDASAGNDLTGAMPVSAGGAFIKDNVGAPHFTSAVGGAFILNVSGNCVVNGWLKVTQGI